MKSIREIFKTNPSLLDEPEVAQLLNYCEQLQDEIVEFKFQKTNNKELAMLDMLKGHQRLQGHRKRTIGTRAFWF